MLATTPCCWSTCRRCRRGGLDATFLVIFVEQGPLTPDGYAKAVAQAERKYSADRTDARGRSAAHPSGDVTRAGARQPRPWRAVGDDRSRERAIRWAMTCDASTPPTRAARATSAWCTWATTTCARVRCPMSNSASRSRLLRGSPIRRGAVERANRLGMMVDVFHASDACVRDVLALSAAPIIASHSSARALVDHLRNLPDDLLRAIAAKGGVIQAVAYKEFVKHDPGREAAEKTLQAEVAKQAGDSEFDSEKHEYLPGLPHGHAADPGALSAGDARRLHGPHPAPGRGGRHRSRRIGFRLRRWRRRHRLDGRLPDA